MKHINTLSFGLCISTFRKSVLSLYFPFNFFVLWPFLNQCEYSPEIWISWSFKNVQLSFEGLTKTSP